MKVHVDFRDRTPKIHVPNELYNKYIFHIVDAPTLHMFFEDMVLPQRPNQWGFQHNNG